MTNNYSTSFKTGLMMFVFVLFAAFGMQKGATAQTYYPMATADYSEDFANISGWTNDYASGTGAQYWRESAAATGSTPVNTFNAFVSATTGGVQKGTESMILLATGTNITCTEFLLDFTGRNAGTISLDWTKVANTVNASPRSSDITIQYSIDGGVEFFDQVEFTPVRVLNNGTAESGSLTSIALPSSLNGVSQVVIRLKVWNNGQTTGSGNRPKFQIDNLVVTSTPGAAAPEITASVATLPDFGSINVGATSASQSFTIDAINLVSDVTVTIGGDYQVSLDNTNWFSTVDIPMGSGTLTAVPVYVQFSPLSSGVQSSTVFFTATGSSGDNVGVIGTGVATTSELSDIIVDPTFVYPTNIDYSAFQETDLTATSLEVARFILRDGGASAPDGDGFPTILNSLDFGISGSSVLRRVALYNGSTELGEFDAAGTLSFTGAPLATGVDANTVLSIRVSFLDVVTDNTQFDFTVTAATADLAGSNFAATNAGGAATSIAGDDNKIEVTASLLAITTQPSTTIVGAAMSNVVVRANDALGNRDLDFAGDVEVTSTGSLVGSPVIVAASSGTATFSALTHDAAGTGLTLTAASAGLTSAVSDAFDITGPPILTFEMADVVTAEASHPSATNDAGISPASLTRSADLTATNNSGRFNATNWSTSTTLDNSISYMEFTISPADANSAFSVENIFVAIQRSASGTRAIALRSSVDGYATDLGGAFTIVDNTSTQTFDFVFSQALSSSPVTYRVYMYNSEGAGGSAGIGDFAGNDIEVYGTIATLECNDPLACNYNPADSNTSGCTYAIDYYVDADGDGYASMIDNTCTPGVGYSLAVLPLGDCDDSNFNANPGVTEDLCNGIDDDCDAMIDEGAVVGCTDPLASNYNAAANCPGSCSYAGSFTPGNLVAIRGGDGSSAIPTSGNAHSTFLEQMDTDGNSVSVLPLTGGATQLATNLGSTASGFISRTQDASGIVVAGYDVADGASITGADRVANLVDVDYNVTRLFDDASVYTGGANIRGAASNGTDVWTAGANTGIYHAGPGTPEVISNNSTNNRVIKQFNGDLYFSTGSTGAGAVGIYRIAGSPTSGSNDATLVVATGGNPYDFEFSPNGKTLYVAEDNASTGGVKKYTLTGTTWNLTATYNVLNYGSVSGLAIDFSGSTPVIYAVSRNTSVNETIIVSFFDDNVSGNVAFNTLKVGDYLTVRYRDIEFAPCAGTTWYEDADGDGYGNPNVSIVDCMQPFGWVAVAGDCNDNLFYVNPGATELCGNNQDDDCDGTVNEGCPIGGPSNDEFVLANAVSAASFPLCTNRVVNLTNATSSPQATTTAPVGAGQDVWYAFVASTNGARITSTSTTCDVVIELQDATNTALFVENETTTGAEILVANNLTPGDTYYVLVRNFNPSSVGTVSTCIQNMATSQPNNGTTFNNLCSFIKCQWNGAQLYSVTFDDGTNQYTASSTSTQIPFSLLPGIQYGVTYGVTFSTTFIQNDAAGNPTTTVVTSAPYAVTIEEHLAVALRATDRCPATRSLGSFIGTDRVLCGVVGYEWEFTLADEFGTPISIEPVIVSTTGTSRYVRVSSIAGVQGGDFYNVRVRPVFSYGAGNFGDTYMLCVAGSAGMVENNPVMDMSTPNTGDALEVAIYPNPTAGEFVNVRISNITSETIQVKVLDAVGRVVMNNQYSVSGSLNSAIVFDRTLASGLYTLEVIDGNAVVTEKMIVE